jgi:predicted RecB family nuclease
MRVTTEIIEAYLNCPTKCFLRAHSEVGTGNAYADWVRTETEGYRNASIKRLMEEGASPDECVTGLASTKDLKTANWRLAVDAVVQTGNLESRIHTIERIPSEGRGRAAQFIPIRLVIRNKLSKSDKLLLAFDAFVLSEMLGRPVRIGKIIHGDKHSTLKVKTAGLNNRVGKLTEKIAMMLTIDKLPDLVLNRHCGECEFKSRCRQKAVEKDDLSLLSGLTEKERKKSNSEGIFTVTQLSYTFRPRRRPRRLRNKRERYHHSLRALAIREKKIYIVGTPELKIEGTPVYLDVEGLPDRDFYYLIGVRIGKDGAVAQHVLWADTTDDEQRIWSDFLAILKGVENPVLVHYGRFETTFLKRMHDRYGGPPEDSAAAKALKAPVNLLTVIFAQVYFPIYTNGLKEVAGSMGFNWSDAKASGVHSLVWRYTWEQSRDPAVKQTLVQYNAEDCAALEIVTNALVKLTRSIGRPGVDAPMADDVVNVQSMKRQWPFSFDNKTSSIQEMEFLRKAAYWNYQRDRVHFRDSNRRVRKARRVLAGCNTTSMRINKVVVNEVSPECPTCKRISTVPKALRERILYDLHFGHFSIKRWVVKYVYQTYLCWRCQLIFGLDKRFRKRLKFGWNLVAYFVYQVIELCIPQRVATQNMNRLFGFNLNCCTANTFKARAAEFYRETYQQILCRVAGGALVHADETKANVKGKAAYVWVFTNLCEVAYLYADTREAEVLQTTLAGFKGVLVSDFYAAYDSLDCPQQKCLTHLLRDLNDEILKHPYDEELKQLVVAFARLVKPMVETVDRYGLKRHFLIKHRVFVGRFYKALARTVYQSEAALKCKERFERNREKLFTFLDYDEIPWNNNNAEHAIKAYAALRNVMQGTSTRAGTEEYLILLSICETCEYQGLDFLDFLHSGEKDIEAFAKTRRRRRSLAGPSLVSPVPACLSPAESGTQ